MRNKEELMRELAQSKPDKAQNSPEMAAWTREKLTLEVLCDLRDAVVALKTEKK